MKRLKNFLIWASGASVDIVNKCDDKEVTKYVNIGIVILAIALLGTFSFTTFITFAFGTNGVPFEWIYYPIGLIWGFIVLSIDRAIVSTISKKDNWIKTTMKSIPRFALALMIGVVVATPVEMYIFNKEINTHIDKHVEEIITENLTKEFDNQLIVLESKYETSKESYEKYHQMYEDEVNGRKSGIPGKGARANEYMKLELESLVQYNSDKDSLESFKKNMADYIDAINLDSLKTAYINENIGVEYRVNTLYNMSSLHWFISILFITIELLPLLVKLMAPKGSYDEIADDIRDKYIAFSKNGLDRLNDNLENKLKINEQELIRQSEIIKNDLKNDIDFYNIEYRRKVELTENDHKMKMLESKIEYDDLLDETIQVKRKQVNDKEVLLSEKELSLNLKENELLNKENEIKEKIDKYESDRNEILKAKSLVDKKEVELNDKVEELKEKYTYLINKENEIKIKYENFLKEKNNKEAELNNLYAENKDRYNSLLEKEKELSDLKDQFQNKLNDVRERDKVLSEMDLSIRNKKEDMIKFIQQEEDKLKGKIDRLNKQEIEIAKKIEQMNIDRINLDKSIAENEDIKKNLKKNYENKKFEIDLDSEDLIKREKELIKKEKEVNDWINENKKLYNEIKNWEKLHWKFRRNIKPPSAL